MTASQGRSQGCQTGTLTLMLMSRLPEQQRLQQLQSSRLHQLRMKVSRDCPCMPQQWLPVDKPQAAV